MNEKDTVLIVEDDAEMRETCRRMLSRAGYATQEARDGESALVKFRSGTPCGVVLLDLKLPGIDGSRVLQEIKNSAADAKVVIMTGFATVKSAVHTMKLGADDYIVKPFEKDELLAIVAQQFRVGHLERRVDRLQSELRGKYGFSNIVGQSKSMEAVFERILAARQNKANVLLVGESGTGKELIAKAIHYNGVSAAGPFVPINCAALPESLVESELFGHVKGAFTGAMRDSTGLFRTAHGGTIVLDEVFEMPLDIQAKLLRVIQERTVRPVGGVGEHPVDVRVIAITNREPADALERETIRQDLFYRLSVITIRVPALRDRPEDIRLLVEHFCRQLAARYGFRLGGIQRRVFDLLEHYSWPGNVRELENVVEQWFAMDRRKKVRVPDLPSTVVAAAEKTLNCATRRPHSDIVPLHEAERMLARQAWEAADHNKSKAADLLGISRKKLYKLLGDDASNGA